MVRRSKRHSKRGGGLWDTITSGTQSMVESAKKSAQKISTPTPPPASLTPAPAPPPPPPASTIAASQVPMGGRRRYKKGGSYHSNYSRTNLASSAAPYSGKSASPQVIIGGRTRKRRCTRKSRKGKKHRHTKTCRR